MTTLLPDTIDLLAGIEPGSRLDALRNRRSEARKNAQDSYLALFESEELESVSALERFAVASFVTGLHGDKGIADFYASGLRRRAAHGIVETVAGEVARGATSGPYGSYPAGPLSSEDQPGLAFAVSPAGRETLGEKLAAAFDHAHRLVFSPRDSSPEALQALLQAGWSTTGIVTLSQLVAFLSFQIRVIAGLRALLAAPAASSKDDVALELASAVASGRL
ncbi:CMD domain protein [Microvirga antarctica]|uniref:CMD domain protein n=1 Tax=Microvirga antarctica TaxID=2819233 RepID=UPI001B30545F|nr:CMD domain protein [Microvirga antarctica]